MKKNKTNKIVIWPHHPAYIIFMWGIGGAFGLLLLIVTPIILIIESKPILLFDAIMINEIWQQLFIAIPIAILYCYIFVNTIRYRIIFTDKNFITTRAPEAQDKKFKIPCKDILDYKFLAAGSKYNSSIFFYIELHCIGEKKYKIFITSFSKKQIVKILKMIQERGGLQNQGVEDFINH